MSDRAKFSTLPTIDGFDVIDERGYPVDHRPTKAEANGVAFRLNSIAYQGPKALAKAMCARPKNTI